MKFTKQQEKHINEAVEIAHNRGRIEGLTAGKMQVKDEYERRKNETHLKALDTIARIGSALGQSIEAINRAMQSDRGQL